MKHLPKHLQPRWRYLAVKLETWPETTLTRDAFQRQLWYAAQNLLGDIGSAALDLRVMRFDHDDTTGSAIVRVRRGESERARAVLATVSRISDVPVGLRVSGVGGTVRACEEKYMGREREEFHQRHVVFEDAERSAVVRNGRLDLRVDGAFVGATTLDLQ